MDAPNTSKARCYPSVIEHMITVLVTAMILEQHSRMPEANFLVTVFVFLSTMGLAIAYCVRLGERLRSSDEVKTSSNSSVMHWFVLPVGVLIMLSSAATHWPATARFALSKSSFDELVAQAYNGQQPQGFPRRVGLYWIDNVKDNDFDYSTRQGTIGFVTGVALIDECGLRYDRSDRRSSHYLTTRIAPCWYVTEW